MLRYTKYSFFLINYFVNKLHSFSRVIYTYRKRGKGMCSRWRRLINSQRAHSFYRVIQHPLSITRWGEEMHQSSSADRAATTASLHACEQPTDATTMQWGQHATDRYLCAKLPAPLSRMSAREKEWMQSGDELNACLIKKTCPGV